MFSNYKYLRNENLVLQALGFEQIPSGLEERYFANKLFEKSFTEHGIVRDEMDEKPLLIMIVGGFCDRFSAFCYRIKPYLVNLVESMDTAEKKSSVHIYYREYDEAKDAKKIVEYYAGQGSKCLVIGHSWGGSSSVLQLATDAQYCIKQLITLDPVGIIRPKKRPNVEHWLNIYVDYKKAPYTRKNTVARIGRPWEENAFADLNISSTLPHHEQALGLLCAHGLGIVENFLK